MAIITTDKATERVGRSVNGSTKKYADEKARNELNKIFTDMAYAGSGLGSCTTAATTAAKTATLANYLLLKNVPVAVFFQNGVNVANATLNINSQGAKPIFINGVALPAGAIAERTTVTMVYDGTNYNVTGINNTAKDENPLLVDLGLASGRLWATRNIDVTQPNGFAASPYQYECSFFSWGNTEGHNPINSGAFQYNWGTGNDTEPYVSSPGAALTGNIGLGYDAAHANLGGDWRMPTTEEYAELFAGVKYIDANGDDIPSETTNKLITFNGVVGIRLKSTANGREIFFPCSGYGYGTSWIYRGSNGFYWASSLHSATDGRYLFFDSGGVHPQYNNFRFYGFPVRAVQ